jgi:hydroxymethylpyrimidine pyrophosphatase-like HAD family hydrolase
MQQYYVGVDFDGTVVKHKYPDIGEPVPNCLRVLKRLESKGHKVILHTMRGAKELNDAIKYLRKNGIKLYAANKNPAQNEWTKSKKIWAHFYIDDCSVGCPLIFSDKEPPYVDWYEIEKYFEKLGLI